MTNCFVYLRVSGLAQVEGEGFPRQLAACEDYARRNDLVIVKTFQDEGVSGKNELDNRPALRELLEELMADGVKVVIVEKLDRLARDLIVQETIIQDFQRRGFRIISATEQEVTSNDPTRVLIRQILGAFFEYDRKMISARLADARRRVKARTGRCEGRLPYGVYKPETAALETMRLWKRQGLTCAQIAARANGIGLPTRSGGEWHPGTVSKILARKAQSCAEKPTQETLCTVTTPQNTND